VCEQISDVIFAGVKEENIMNSGMHNLVFIASNV
jgi:hypothetical protein